MKHVRLIGVGVGAVAGVAAAAAAVLLEPRGGPQRRRSVADTGKRVARSSAQVTALMGGRQQGQGSGDSPEAGSASG